MRPGKLIDVDYHATGAWDLDNIRELPIKPGLVIDLGCGDGVVLERFIRYFGCRAIGIEMDQAKLNLARERLGNTATIIEGDFWEADLSGADVVYLFWEPRMMFFVKEFILPKMKPGSWLVSHLFPIPLMADDFSVGTLHCYQVL